MLPRFRSPTVTERATGDRPVDVGTGWAHGGGRLRSIDVMRGAVLALMLFTPPIRYAGTYPFFEHAAWVGWTVSDLVFPLFLFVSGLSLAFLLRDPVTSKTKQRLVRRLAALLVIGVVYNAIGVPLDLSTIRVTGVLQLIGISGAVAALAILLTRRSDGSDRKGALATIAAALIAGYGAILVWSPGPCDRFAVGCSPFFPLDEAIIGRGHLYRPLDATTFDPEGLAVSVAAAALVLAGYLAARSMSTLGPRRAGVMLAALGAVGTATALILHEWLPISKRLFTPTFAILAVSIGTVLFVAFFTLFDLESRKGFSARIYRVRKAVAWPFVVLGANALVVFLSERVLLDVARRTMIAGQPTGRWLLERIGSAPSAALVLSTALLLVVFGITAFMHWRDWRVVL